MFDWLRKRLCPYERTVNEVWNDVLENQRTKYLVRETPYKLICHKGRYYSIFKARLWSDHRKRVIVVLDMFSDWKTRETESPLVCVGNILMSNGVVR